jgi:hypothetical protein
MGRRVHKSCVAAGCVHVEEDWNVIEKELLANPHMGWDAIDGWLA